MPYLYFIPKTSSFLETFIRDKGTKKPKTQDISAVAKEEPGDKHDFDFVCKCLMPTASTEYSGRMELIPCLCNYENSWKPLSNLF